MTVRVYTTNVSGRPPIVKLTTRFGHRTAFAWTGGIGWTLKEDDVFKFYPASEVEAVLWVAQGILPHMSEEP